MPANDPPKLRFKELPDFLKKKIEFPVRQEKTACWHWTGEVKKAEMRYKRYPAYDGYRVNNGRFGPERATPKATHPLTNKKTDAHRLVYSFARCIAVDDVPKLERCHVDTCVSPWHVREIGLTNAQRDRAQGLRPKPEVEAEALTNEDVMALMKSKRPIASAEPGMLPLVEEDIGVPAGSLSWELYLEYCVWDEKNPDDDDY